MAEYRCLQCHAICEDEETPSSCPICGAEKEEAFAPRSSVENLFDLEPLRRQQTRPGGEPARLKERAAPDGPLASSPTLEDAGPLRAASTLELDDSDLSVGALPPPPPIATAPAPPLANVPTSTGVSRLDLLTSGRLSSGLSSLSALTGAAAAYEAGRETVDLDDADLEQVLDSVPPLAPRIPPAPPPPAPAARAPRDEATGPLPAARGTAPRDETTGPLPAARGTAPRDEATGPLPAARAAAPRADATGPVPAAAGAADAPAPRSLRGRVAFPLRADQTPPPTTLPKEVDELAVAGEPPLPARRSSRPLTGQTESLSSIRARQRRRAMGSLAVGALIVAALAGGIYLASRGPGDRGARPSPDLRSAAPPDRGRPDLAPPDLGRPDAPSPDQARPDQATRRVPVVAAKKVGRPERRPPDAGAPPSAAAKAEAQASYQEGLRRLLTGQNEEAVRLFNQALTRQPRFSLAYRGLGLAYQKLGRTAMARAAFERYLLMQPGADDADAIRARIEGLKE